MSRGSALTTNLLLRKVSNHVIFNNLESHPCLASHAGIYHLLFTCRGISIDFIFIWAWNLPFERYCSVRFK